MDHYSTPVVYASSTKIPTFFDMVIKRPVTDLAMSLEAFCLSGVDGKSMYSHTKHMNFADVSLCVIGKLVKQELQLRGEVVAIISEKLCMFSPMLSS